MPAHRHAWRSRQRAAKGEQQPHGVGEQQPRGVLSWRRGSKELFGGGTWASASLRRAMMLTGTFGKKSNHPRHQCTSTAAHISKVSTGSRPKSFTKGKTSTGKYGTWTTDGQC